MLKIILDSCLSVVEVGAVPFDPFAFRASARLDLGLVAACLIEKIVKSSVRFVAAEDRDQDIFQAPDNECTVGLVAELVARPCCLFDLKWKGSEFNSIRASGDRVAGYTVIGNTADELIMKHNEVRSRIKVISNDGEDMIRRDLLTGLHNNNGFLASDK